MLSLTNYFYDLPCELQEHIYFLNHKENTAKVKNELDGVFQFSCYFHEKFNESIWMHLADLMDVELANLYFDTNTDQNDQKNTIEYSMYSLNIHNNTKLSNLLSNIQKTGFINYLSGFKLVDVYNGEIIETIDNAIDFLKEKMTCTYIDVEYEMGEDEEMYDYERDDYEIV